MRRERETGDPLFLSMLGNSQGMAGSLSPPSPPPPPSLLFSSADMNIMLCDNAIMMMINQ